MKEKYLFQLLLLFLINFGTKKSVKRSFSKMIVRKENSHTSLASFSSFCQKISLVSNIIQESRLTTHTSFLAASSASFFSLASRYKGRNDVNVRNNSEEPFFEGKKTYFGLLLLQLLASLSFLDDPFTNFINTFSRTGFIL